jgi:hypothetical protein
MSSAGLLFDRFWSHCCRLLFERRELAMNVSPALSFHAGWMLPVARLKSAWERDTSICARCQSAALAYSALRLASSSFMTSACASALSAP